MPTISEALATAVQHHQAGRLDVAQQIYIQVLTVDPDRADALHLLGVAASQTGQYQTAIGHIRRAIELNGTEFAFHNNLGNALKSQGELDEAVASYRLSLNLKPDFAEAHCNLGNALRAQGKLDEAIACHLRALELKPDYAEAHNDLGNAYYDISRLDEAVTHYRRALDLKPDYSISHFNLGTALHDQGNLEEAVAHFRRAVELDPEYADAHNNLSLLLLQRGDFEHGWREYEWRWKCKEHAAGALTRPKWDGSVLVGGQTLLLHADQGLGDTLQFIRYAPLAKCRAGQVLLRCSKRLIPLLSRCRGIDKFIPQEADMPHCDAEAQLSSLPLTFGTTLESVPQDVPYLFADEELVERWRDALSLREFRIGIAWQGNPAFRQDKVRSIPLIDFAPLAKMNGLRLISLQKGHGVNQLADVQRHFPVIELPLDLDESAGAFMDTAAVMMNLDLVVTSDTAIAHLAGGLGVPVWIGLAHVPEWRWLLGRSDSPWYPTMKLFRQSSPGNWPSVFEQMKAELTDWISKRRSN